MKKNNKSKKINMFGAGIGIIVVAISTPFLIIFATNTKFTISSIDKLGTIGDFFGGSTVGLLSLASIFFLIHTIGIQKDELKLTRDEFITGNTTAKVQQIDNAFFNMLSLHHQIVDNIKIIYKEETLTGRAAIAILLSEIYKQNMGKTRCFIKDDYKPYFQTWQDIPYLDETELNKLMNESEVNQEELDQVYSDFQKNYGNDIGHYMRNNYRIVKYIVNNVAIDKKEQKKMKEESGREPIIGDRRYYFGMLRAQWSNAEFELILINSLYTKNKKFKDLILKYDVLDIEKPINLEQDTLKFKLKDDTNIFKPYRSLIEIEKPQGSNEPMEKEKKKWKRNSLFVYSKEEQEELKQLQNEEKSECKKIKHWS